MKKRVKKLWVEALRSGKYQQGTGQLRNEYNRFCCLGVLCNLHAQAHPKIAKRQTNPESYLGESWFTPSDVIEWAGLAHPNPRLLYENYDWPLSVLNDREGLSFKRIATLIEKQL